jgi:hypothetical protein
MNILRNAIGLPTPPATKERKSPETVGQLLRRRMHGEPATKERPADGRNVIVQGLLASQSESKQKALEVKRTNALKAEIIASLQKLNDEFFREARGMINDGTAFGQSGKFNQLLKELENAALSLVGAGG